MPSREPAEAGVLDKRLGVSNKKDVCEVRRALGQHDKLPM